MTKYLNLLLYRKKANDLEKRLAKFKEDVVDFKNGTLSAVDLEAHDHIQWKQDYEALLASLPNAKLKRPDSLNTPLLKNSKRKDSPEREIPFEEQHDLSNDENKVPEALITKEDEEDFSWAVEHDPIAEQMSVASFESKVATVTISGTVSPIQKIDYPQAIKEDEDIDDLNWDIDITGESMTQDTFAKLELKQPVATSKPEITQDEFDGFDELEEQEKALAIKEVKEFEDDFGAWLDEEIEPTKLQSFPASRKSTNTIDFKDFKVPLSNNTNEHFDSVRRSWMTNDTSELDSIEDLPVKSPTSTTNKVLINLRQEHLAFFNVSEEMQAYFETSERKHAEFVAKLRLE